MNLNYCFPLYLLSLSNLCFADGSNIDKIYHPYVDQMEWELEWRLVQQNKEPASLKENLQYQKLGLGKAISEYIFIEAYVIGEQSKDEELSVESYEAEVLIQLSEQGEYALDYGIVLELEKRNHANIWEYGTTLLLEKELGQYSATANIGLIYEWGDDIDNEWESTLALQYRYRYSPRFEPALEFYAGQDARGLGPVIMGMEKLAINKALKWELGTIFGLNDNTADVTLRAVLEYEF